MKNLFCTCIHGSWLKQIRDQTGITSEQQCVMGHTMHRPVSNPAPVKYEITFSLSLLIHIKYFYLQLADH
jgi:hypothetical protein